MAHLSTRTDEVKTAVSDSFFGAFTSDRRTFMRETVYLNMHPLQNGSVWTDSIGANHMQDTSHGFRSTSAVAVDGSNCRGMSDCYVPKSLC